MKTSIVLVLFVSVLLPGCSQFKLSDNPNALRVRAVSTPYDTFNIIVSDNSGTSVSGKIRVYDEYNRKLMETELKEGYSHFDYPVSTHFVHVKVISEDGREGKTKVWRTRTLSARQ